ncbi:MAG TPA: hypothetical protein VGC65_05225 [Bacteroidia bacterium]|jgi:hypothetical protein
MQKIFYLLLSSLLLFSSCKKEPKTVYVTYKIIETSNNTPTYTVSYTLASGTTKSQGNLTQSKWVSDKITDVEVGKYITLSVEGSGGGDYDMFIYINGSLYAHRKAEDGFGRQTLESQVPE